MEVNGDQQLLGYHILQNIFFWVQQKKEIHSWENEDRIFIFEWTIHYIIPIMFCFGMT